MRPKREYRIKRLVDLTPTQLVVAKALALGLRTEEIAAEIKCAEKTVGTHRSAIFTRLGIRNSAELARLAIAQGVVSMPVDTDGPAQREVTRNVVADMHEIDRAIDRITD